VLRSWACDVVGLEFRFELGWDQLLCEMHVQIDWSLGTGWNGIEMHGTRRFIVINHVALLGLGWDRVEIDRRCCMGKGVFVSLLSSATTDGINTTTCLFPSPRSNPLPHITSHLSHLHVHSLPQ
jgi:hypothetical protein